MAEQDPATVRASPDPDQVELGQAFRVGAEGDEAVQLMVTLLDRQDAALPIRRLRDWGLGLAKVQFGETVVDVGSGTGTMLRELGTLVGPGGRAVGVEPNPRLRAVATERATASANISVIDGLAGTLPFDDESVDLVWCERVLQHLTDPQGAFTEFARVLRPGGRAVVLDSDHASRVISDIDFEVEAKILDAFIQVMPNARAARHIPRQAMAAGFTVDPDIGSAALLLPTRPRGRPVLVGGRCPACGDTRVDQPGRGGRGLSGASSRRRGGLRLRGGHRLRVPAAEARLTRSESRVRSRVV